MVMTRARYAGITRKVTALIIIGLTVLFALNPIIIPIQVSMNVRDMHEVVDALQPGDVVFYDYGFGGRLDKTGTGMQEAVCRHLIEKDVIIVYNMIAAIGVEAMSGRANMMRYVYGMEDYQNHPDYGVKFVTLRYLAGYGTSLKSLADDVRALYPVDEFGTPMDQHPLWASVQSAADIDVYIITMHTLQNVAPPLLNPYGIDILSLVPILYETQAEQLYRVGLISGYISGLRMGAEYSSLTGFPTIAMSYLASYMFTAIAAYIGWIVTNYVFLVGPGKVKEE